MKKIKPNKFKLTPEAYKKILIIAGKLPKFQKVNKNGVRLFRKITRVVMGSDLKVKEVNGKPVINNKRYVETLNEPLLINHPVELVEIYQKDGDRGVDIYVKHFQDLVKKESERKEPKVETVIQAPIQ